MERNHPRDEDHQNTEDAIEDAPGSVHISRSGFIKMGLAGGAGMLIGGRPAAAYASKGAVTPASSSGDVYDEPFRGQFHFSPRKNWINDPNGLVYYRGEYHLFFQHNPYGDTWGNMSWGHAVSPDMLQWKELPVALRPDELGDIFSGSAVVDENDTSGFFDGASGMIAIYTNAGDEQVQSLAYSRDRGRTWTKYAENPVIPNPGVTDFRDPKVFWHEPTAKWVMVLAAGDRVMFYGSQNLREWNKLSEFGIDHGAHGGVWECPELFELFVDNTSTRRWILQVDINPGAPNGGSGGQYFVGDFDGERFTNENPHDTVLWVDWGKDFYATQDWNSIPEDDGRRLWVAWMNNWAYAEKIPTDPWRGSMSVPREVTLTHTPDGTRLAQQPIRELETLRGRRYSATNILVTQEGAPRYEPPQNIDGRTIEIIAEFQVLDAEEFGFRVRQRESQDDAQHTLVGYDTQSETLFVDRRDSGIIDFSEHFPGRHSAPLTNRTGRVRLRLLVDRSSVEVFAGGGTTVITERVFPRGTSGEFEPYAKSGRALLRSVDVYQLESTWR